MTYEIAQRARRRTWLVVAGVVVLVMIVVAGTVALVNVFGDGERPGGAEADLPAAPAARPDVAPQAVAPDPSDSDLGWVSVQGVDLPISATDGPRNVQDGRAWGFSRTARGAVFAAAHISWASGALTGPAVYRPTIAEQVVGPEKDAFLAATDADYRRTAAERGITAGRPLGRGYAEFIGYLTEGTPSDNYVIVRLLLRYPPNPGETAGTRVERTEELAVGVVWERDDWRLVAPPGGSWSTNYPAQSATYTPLASP